MKITLLTSRYPYPLDKGDKLRAYHQLCHLAEHHTVQLLCVVDRPPTEEEQDVIDALGVQVTYYHRPTWMRWISAASAWSQGWPAQVGFFFSPNLKKQIYKAIIAFHPDVIYCQLIRMAAYVRHLPYPKVLDYMDCFSEGLARQAKVQPAHKAWAYRLESALVRRYERAIRSDFDAVTIISDRDRLELPLMNKDAVHVVPNGIDTDFFRPCPEHEIEHDVVFVGNLGYPPNAQAVQTLRTWRSASEMPEVRYLIAGASPSREMKHQDEKLWRVPGWMDDIRDAYRSSHIFVAPLTTGSGLQNKLLEAMACGLPCITTDIANDAMRATPGVHLMITKDASSYRRVLGELLSSPDKRQRLGEAGRTFVLNHYQWSVFNSQLEQILTDAKDRYQSLYTTGRPV